MGESTDQQGEGSPQNYHRGSQKRAGPDRPSLHPLMKEGEGARPRPGGDQN
jgi:hypothetical protein